MKTYLIGEIEELTGVKTHILRYWEEVIPGFAPRKDIGGRRVYTQRELDIILRLKYLIYEKKFTIEGARNQIIEDAETVNNNFEIINSIRTLRADLIDLYQYAKKNHI